MAMENSITIPWYWAPYVIGLGVIDWWEETSQVSHARALTQGTQYLGREKHSILRSIAAMTLLFSLLVLFVREVAGPWLQSGAFAPSAAELLWGSFSLAAGACVLCVGLFSLTLYRRLRGLYQRGYHRLMRSRR